MASADGNTVEVHVRDSGIGLAPALLPRVFEMFTQAETVPARAAGGRGIGLTLVRSLVEMHGGSVTAVSAGHNKGSVFTVRLPQATYADDTLAIAAGDRLSRMEGQPRILVVDDNKDSADSLGALLEALGARVTVAHDGETALRAVPLHRPTIVFLDIGMPRMNGYELARRIRKLPGGTDLLLVALTGWGQEKDRRRSAAAGFDHHLVKPADLDELEILLRSARSAG